MSSQPAVTTKNTATDTSKTPLGTQAPMFSDIWNKTQGTVDNFSPYTGDIVAGPTNMQNTGVNDLFQAAGNTGTNATGTADVAKKVASGYFMDPTNDPTFQGAVQSALTPITRALQEQVLPGIVDKSIQAGGTSSGPSAYGGASQDLQENQAVQNWAKQSADTTASMANASRTAGMNLTTALPALNTSANSEALAPASTELAAGGTQQGLNQDILNNLLQKWQLSSSGSLPILQQASSILNSGGFGNNTGTSNETDTGAVPNMLTQILQGLTGGAGVANSLFGAAKGGTSAISGLTAALQSISDRRLKSGIAKIGTTFDGLSIYRYYFHGTGRWEIGFMADEVEKEIPAAVVEVCGIKTLNYEIATERAAEMSNG